MDPGTSSYETKPEERDGLRMTIEEAKKQRSMVLQ